MKLIRDPVLFNLPVRCNTVVVNVSRYDLIYCNTRVFASQPEEKSKFDGIFESLSPLNGLLSGDKVKPVLINSNLPLDVLGKVPHSLQHAVHPISVHMQ